MIDVSVIVPVYNGEKYIKTLLNDLRNQTFNSVEFLIINDGSTDNTSKIIELYLNKINDKRFKYYLRQNEGVSATRNYGISIANGKYLIFVDSDDRLDETLISNYFHEISIRNTDIEFFPAIKIKNGKTVGKIAYDEIASNSIINAKKIINYFVEVKAWGYPFCYISKASLWKDVRFNSSIAFQEDVLVLFEILDKNPNVKIHINNTPYYYYYIHENSALRNMKISELWQFIDVDDIISKLIKNNSHFADSYKYILGLKLSSLMIIISRSILEKDRENYLRARKEFLNLMKIVKIPSIKLKVRRYAQYLLIKVNATYLIGFVYRSLLN